MDVQLIGYDNTKSDYNSQDGEVETAIGYISRQDGCMVSNISVKNQYTLPPGMTQMTRHLTNDSDNIIASSITDGMVTLWWARYDINVTAYEVDDFAELLTAEHILCHTTTRDTLIIGTSHGIVTAKWIGTSYSVSGIVRTIDIEFGLRQAGTLVTSDTIEVSSDVTHSVTSSGSGANRPHPTETTAIATQEKVSTAITKIYADTIRTQVTDKGYVCYPILIRYALRTASGMHIMPSAPILMLPTVLPPRIGIETITDSSTSKTHIRPDLTACNYHELCYRIPLQDINIDSNIVAIDIYATTPFDTYDTSRTTEGYATSYSDVLAATASSHPRGRRSPDSTTEVFDGHYSVGDNIFTDNYINPSDIHGDVWMMYANNRLTEQICDASEFHLIASIPSADITVSDTFVNIPVYYGLGQPVTMDNTSIHHSSIVVNSLCQTNGQMAAAVCQRILPAPNSPGNTYSGDASLHSLVRMTVTVTINDRGRIFMIKTTKPGFTTTLSQSMPRYIFYPDRRAQQMTISQGDEAVTVELTPHPVLNGAYWMGGLGSTISDSMASSPAVVPTDIPVSDRVDTAGMIMMTHINDNTVYCTDSAITLSCDSITSLRLASRTDLYSTIGRYPMYAFTTNGVWILEHSSTTGRLTSAQLLTSHPCRQQAAITAMEDAFAFVSDDGIYTVSQHSVSQIMTPWTGRTFNLTALPHIDAVLDQCSVPDMCIGTVVERINDCRILYDNDRHLLIAYIPGTSICYAYSASTRIWTVVALPIGHTHKTDSGILHICNDNAVGVLCDESADYDGLIVTRPIKAGREIGPHNIAIAEVLGYVDDDNVWLILYGSNDMMHWHLIQSARRRWLEDLNQTTYRYHRYVIVSRLIADEYIYGISCRQA